MPNDTSSIEDWTDNCEFIVWGSGKPLSISSIKEMIESESDPESDNSFDEFKNDLYLRAAAIIEEVDRRSGLLGDAYPFKLIGDVLEYKTEFDVKSTYLLCLGIVVQRRELQKDAGIRTLVFETISLNAAKNYFHCEGVRVGAPWKTDDLISYKQLLEQVLEFAPELGSPKREFASNGGDEGWDMFLAKPFADKMYPQFIAVGNCATGRNFRDKGAETRQEHFFDELFHKAPRSPVLELFSIPFIISDDDRSRKTSRLTILFDRLRLSECLPTFANLTDPTASAIAIDWLTKIKSLHENVRITSS